MVEKEQAEYLPGKRCTGQLLVLGDCTHKCETSGPSTDHLPEIKNEQQSVPDPPGVYLAGTRPALFPLLFITPSLLVKLLLHRRHFPYIFHNSHVDVMLFLIISTSSVIVMSKLFGESLQTF